MSNDPSPQAAQDADRKALADAATYEAQIAEQAKAIRMDHNYDTPGNLDRGLFSRLHPLLLNPLPAAYIKYVPALAKGKPYESTGVRSVQVQIDRMNNVLTPLWWWDVVNYEQDGRLCHVNICVGNYSLETLDPNTGMVHTRHEVLVVRSSAGGVNVGNTLGNVYKGSYTNAAKRAFAALGPGHEVYLGAADLDPDTNIEIAAGQEQLPAGQGPPAIGTAFAKKIVDRVWEVPAAKAQLQLAASHAAERDVGDCSTKAKATAALATLTHPQSERLDAWVVRKTAEQEQPAGQQTIAEPPEGETL